MLKMMYEPVELLPIVARLSKKITGNDSTSISYERAQQLMEAVLYCIAEYERSSDTSLAVYEKPDAELAYLTGINLVKKKAGDTFARYKLLMRNFDGYENTNLTKTVGPGISGFFRLYDYTFAPQNTIITMDYPTLNFDTSLTGIDALSEYVDALLLEQKFLSRLPREYVLNILFRYATDYRSQFFNISTIISRNLIVRSMLRGRGIEVQGHEVLLRYAKETSLDELEDELRELFQTILTSYYDTSLIQKMKEYYDTDIRSLAVSLQNLQDYRNVKNVVII